MYIVRYARLVSWFFLALISLLIMLWPHFFLNAFNSSSEVLKQLPDWFRCSYLVRFIGILVLDKPACLGFTTIFLGTIIGGFYWGVWNFSVRQPYGMQNRHNHPETLPSPAWTSP